MGLPTVYLPAVSEVSDADLTAAVDTAVAGLVAGADAALNTLDELAAALGDDASFATTVTNALATKAPLASPTFTGTLTAALASFTDNVKVASTKKLGIGGAGAAAYGLDVRTPAVIVPQVHLASTDTDAGAYLMSSADHTLFASGGAAWDTAGAAWVAKATTAGIIGVNTGVLSFYTNTGLTVGNQFTPTSRATLSASGLALTDGIHLVFGTSGGSAIGSASNQKLGFWGAAPIVRPSAYTQTYATAAKTHTAAEVAAISTAAATVAAFGFSENQANAIPTAINAITGSLTELKKFVNGIVDDLQAIGLLA